MRCRSSFYKLCLETEARLQFDDATCESARSTSESFDEINVDLIRYGLKRRQVKDVEGVEHIRAKIEIRSFAEERQSRLFDEREID